MLKKIIFLLSLFLDMTTDPLKHLNKKNITAQSFANIRETIGNRKVVFTNGCFDILHLGHVEYLAKARSLGDILIIGLNSDNSVKRLKGEKRPVNPEYARAMLLSALEFVDYIIVFEEDTPELLIKTICPDILVKGGDYSIETIVGADFVLANGGTVEIIPFVDGFSTSRIIDNCKA